MISVVLVDDHALFRSGVRAELESHVTVLGEAGTVEEAVRVHRRAAARRRAPRRAPARRQRRRRDPARAAGPDQYLALSVSDDPQDVIAVIRAGARGYVTKSIDGAELADAIARVHDGDAVFSPRLAGFVLDAFRDAPPPAAPASEAASDHDLEQLTPREREVLQHIARGYLYKEIGLRLGISVKTVEAHVSAVLRKLQLSTRHELTRWAWERLPPPSEGKGRW